MPSTYLAALAAILPFVQAAPLPAHLVKRIQPPGDLFGPTGKPDFWDVAQTSIPNCGWSATSAAIAHVNPDFLSAIIRDNGDGDSATFDIWKYPTLEKDPQIVHKRDLPDNANNKGTVWWSGGIEQAAVQSGEPTNGISPGNALAIQTGIEHDSPRTEHFQAGSLNADQMWEVFGHAAESPVILQTGDGGKLVGGHAYAVLNTTMQGNQRRLALYNPWGGDDVYDYDEVWGQIIMAHHLKNWEGAPKDGPPKTDSPSPPPPPPAPAPEPAPSPAPAPAPEPQPQPDNNSDTNNLPPAPAPAPEPAPEPQPAQDPPQPVDEEEDDNVVWVTVTVYGDSLPAATGTPDAGAGQAGGMEEARYPDYRGEGRGGWRQNRGEW